MRKLIFILTLILSQSTFAVLTIEVTGGITGGQPIAIAPFIQPMGMPPPAENIAQIIQDDLHRSGQFEIVKQLPETPSQLDAINFPVWQTAALPYLVAGQIEGTAQQDYNVEFRLFDVFKTTRMIGLSYKASTKKLRQVAHQISDAIYQALTGERGVFSTKVVYVTVKRGPQGSVYQLNLADADGANPQQMLESSEPILSPAWSPDGNSVAYVSFENQRTAIYVQDIASGKRQKVSDWKGLNTAPAWSPDGQRLALSLSKDDNPEIYLLDLKTRALSRLTNSPAIDTEPEWTPDGQSLFFTSDRGGNPQIYQVATTGGTPKRVTFSGNYNARARVSPDGKKLALLHSSGQGYHIAVLDLDSKQLQVLTRTSLDESPTFAPNGSMVMYATGTNLAAVSIDGQVQQHIPASDGLEVREPAWSPFLN